MDIHPGDDLELVGFDGDGTADFDFDDDPDIDNPKLVDNCASVSAPRRLDLAAGRAELDDELCESKKFEYTHYFDVPASGCETTPTPRRSRRRTAAHR